MYLSVGDKNITGDSESSENKGKNWEETGGGGGCEMNKGINT
jgi:hypothetical protein